MNRKFLYGLIIISIIFSIFFVKGRIEVENNYKTYDVVASYEDFATLAAEREESTVEYFKALKTSGFNSVAILEDTINQMESEPTSTISTEMRGTDLIIKGSPKEIDRIAFHINDTLLEPRNLERVSENEIIIEGKATDIITYSDNAAIYLDRYAVRSTKGSVLEFVGIGFDQEKIDTVKAAGLNVILRPIYDDAFQSAEKSMDRLFATIDDNDLEGTYLIFNGRKSYGAGEDTKDTINKFGEELSKRNMFLGLVEATNQRGHLEVQGLNPVASREDVGMVRVFPTWDYIQKEYDYGIPNHNKGEEIANVYYRAVSERNVASIYVRPFIDNKVTVKDPADYERVLSSLEAHLNERGVTKGPIDAMGNWNVKYKMKLPIAVGIVAAGVLLFSTIFAPPAIVEGILFFIGVCVSLLIYGFGKKLSFGDTFFNLLGIIIYPSLALSFVFKKYNDYRSDGIVHRSVNSYLKGLLILLGAILICFVGALMEVSLLSGTDHLMELVIFRGVKASQLLPIFISIFIFGAFVGFYREKVTGVPKFSLKETVNILNKEILFWHGAVAAVALLALGILVLRSGNTNVKPPTTELLFRNFMEHAMPVRPRTKAIFIGYPALVTLIYIALKKKREVFSLILAVAGSIGLSNLVNTFSHIRTPFLISVQRIGGEFVIAIITSIIWIAVVEIISLIYEKYLK